MLEPDLTDDEVVAVVVELLLVDDMLVEDALVLLVDVALVLLVDVEELDVEDDDVLVEDDDVLVAKEDVDDVEVDDVEVVLRLVVEVLMEDVLVAEVLVLVALVEELEADGLMFAGSRLNERSFYPSLRCSWLEGGRRKFCTAGFKAPPAWLEVVPAKTTHHD